MFPTILIFSFSQDCFCFLNFFSAFYLFFYFHLKQSLTLSPRLECNKQSWLELIFVFLVETGYYQVGQAGLEHQTSSDLPASASQSVGITGVSHRAQPRVHILSHYPELSPIAVENFNLYCFFSHPGTISNN